MPIHRNHNHPHLFLPETAASLGLEAAIVEGAAMGLSRRNGDSSQPIDEDAIKKECYYLSMEQIRLAIDLLSENSKEGECND